MTRAKKTTPPPTDFATCDRCHYRTPLLTDVESIGRAAGGDRALMIKATLDLATAMGAHRCDEMVAERRDESIAHLRRNLVARIGTAFKGFVNATDRVAPPVDFPLGPSGSTSDVRTTSAVRELRYLLAQSRDLFQCAARAYVADWALAALDGRSPTGDAFPAWTPEQLRTEAEREVSRRARYAYNQSTSQTANLMEACETAAYAELVEDLGWVVAK